MLTRLNPVIGLYDNVFRPYNLITMFSLNNDCPIVENQTPTINTGQKFFNRSKS